MIKNKIAKVLFLTLLIYTPIVAQSDQDQATLDKGPVAGQFDYAIEKSSKYEEYRVVRSNWLYKLKSNVLDSLANLKTTISQKDSKIDSLNNKITTLNNNLDSTNEKLNKAINQKDSIVFLGSELPKGKYNSIMWGLVLILAAGAAFLFLLFKRSHQLTSEMKEKYSDLEKEYDAHRKRVLEKEKNMARQHLNELNKIRGRD
ncbi:tRNA (guanine-N1)-methyltransferase [Marinilabilia sp.]|uniref:tRNA (guanine-N1)-methyltransferase n=1 Tax=Marinilabilia sp. TaxID=2021252 RepID=UPI0025BA5BB4|nr:tRNA (guanine-N1)-methyltransferase [Marinilabilia sp.]